MINDLGYIDNKEIYNQLHTKLEKLGKMLNGFINALDK